MAPQGLAVVTLAPASLPRQCDSVKEACGPCCAGLPVVRVFSDPACGPCQVLAPLLVQWQRELAGRLTIALVSGGDTQQQKFSAEQRRLVLLQKEREIADQFKLFATPSAVRTGSAGQIDSQPALADLAIGELVHQAQSERSSMA
jgi:protein-disulfide isomerase-like protein with CxxC motif